MEKIAPAPLQARTRVFRLVASNFFDDFSEKGKNDFLMITIKNDDEKKVRIGSPGYEAASWNGKEFEPGIEIAELRAILSNFEKWARESGYTSGK